MVQQTLRYAQKTVSKSAMRVSETDRVIKTQKVGERVGRG